MGKEKAGIDGIYIPFLRSKEDRNLLVYISDALKDSKKNNSIEVRSAIPKQILSITKKVEKIDKNAIKAVKASKTIRNIGIIAIVALIVGILTLTINVVSLIQDSNSLIGNYTSITDNNLERINVIEEIFDENEGKYNDTYDIEKLQANWSNMILFKENMEIKLENIESLIADLEAKINSSKDNNNE